MMKPVQLSPGHKPVFVRVMPLQQRPVMYREMKLKISDESHKAISRAAAAAKLKQAEWLRQAASEKLARDGARP
jgi:hypothetical protein